MKQHFLLSTQARTLSLSAVARMSEEEARAAFQAIRWSDNQGKPYCPRCGCAVAYKIKTQNRWKYTLVGLTIVRVLYEIKGTSVIYWNIWVRTPKDYAIL